MKNLAQTVMVFCLLKLFSWCPALPLAIAPCTASQTAEETQYERMPTSFSKQITSLQFLTLQGEMGSEKRGTLPCLDSSKECVEQLTQSAIANSPKLKKLEERIALIDERLELMGDRKDYAESRLWTNYLPTSGVGSSVLDIINPFAWIKNLAGGGEMQRDRLAIADLEVKAATLEAARAELERKREEEKVNLGDKVLRLLLDYESATRRFKLIESQLQSFNVSREVFRIRYRLGEGTTEQLLGVEERGDRLNDQLVEARIKQDEAVRELGQVTGLERKNESLRVTE